MQANAADEDDAPDALDIADEDEVLFRRMRMRQLVLLMPFLRWNETSNTGRSFTMMMSS